MVKLSTKLSVIQILNCLYNSEQFSDSSLFSCHLQVVHPSNHATIQSIVRAVGIVPGVPEPCCIPEKMSELAVLFLDTSRNMVLKLYSNMSVETCACR